ncbi:MAG: hypothetical protein HZB13_18805 [Acidobacteria bacterium]|nr:hypothetical protein [Acidobacteriota bacterium]
MSGFLDNYGVSDAKREKSFKRIILGSVSLAVLAVAGYYYWHDFHEKRQISRMLAFLEQRNYDDAYRLWGCDPAQPCRDYNMKKFMEDWGPASPHPDASKFRVRRSRSCNSGVIQILQYAPGDEVLLYVDRKQRLIAFSPFEYCVDSAGRNTKLLDIFFR